MDIRRDNEEMPEPPGLAALKEACERQLGVELHPLGRDQGTPMLSSRLLKLDDAHIYLDVSGSCMAIRAGQHFEAYFTIRNVMYTFMCAIKKGRSSVRVSETQQLEVAVAARPHDIHSGQRRSFYRTSLTSVRPTVPALVREAHESVDPAQITVDDAGWMEGVILDASAGGFAVRVDGKPDLALYGRYHVRFTIPGTARELATVCELRQIRPINDGKAVRLGFLLLPWPSASRLMWSIQPLLAYLTSIQRSRIAG